jgi:hypothetical protein
MSSYYRDSAVIISSVYTRTYYGMTLSTIAWHGLRAELLDNCLGTDGISITTTAILLCCAHGAQNGSKKVESVHLSVVLTTRLKIIDKKVNDPLAK